MTATIIHGNNLDILPTLADCSIDAIVTDPPYELGFMGKRWDASGIAYNVTLWQECLRVLKPGGHLLAFGGTRTYHRTACAIEDAGFEIRDSIHWLYGSGFPKSLDVSKAIDKQAGAERKVIGTAKRAQARSEGWNRPWMENQMQQAGSTVAEFDITAPATEQAKQWAGWGTALKPAHEPIVVARKPLVGTVAANVLEWGTGAINIDASRIGTTDKIPTTSNQNIRGAAYKGENFDRERDTVYEQNQAGRWPANAIIDDTIANSHDDWPRYFYCAKPSRKERNAGLDHLPERNKYKAGGVGGTGGMRSVEDAVNATPVANHHPTVKPLALMRYLVRLVTPPGGTVLDPFAGSGTTLMAAILEGFNAIGIEMTDEYLPIIEGRIAWAEQQAANTPDQQELDL